MVSLYAQLLERDYRDHLDDEAKQQIRYITEGARRMQGLIDDLLLYSKVSGQQEPFQPVDCNQILATVPEDLRARIEQTGSHVEVGPLPVVDGNPTLLLQLFENLVSNAIKFHGDRPPHIRVSCREEDGLWIFSVADNGVGIPPEYWERIFIIFQRLHSREKISGSGIGLAICRNIVERHGGTIWVESVPGEGSTFSFSLPREARAFPAPRRPEAPREVFPG